MDFSGAAGALTPGVGTVNLQLFTNIVIGIAVVALVLYRQLAVRSVRTDRAGRGMLIFAVIGVAQLGQFVSHGGRIGVVGIAALAISLVLAAGLAAARAATMKLWRTDQGWFRQGTVVTLVLWLISIGSHLGIDALAGHLAGRAEDVAGLGQATLLLYLAVSLGIQSVLLARRVSALSNGSLPAGNR